MDAWYLSGRFFGRFAYLYQITIRRTDLDALGQAVEINWGLEGVSKNKSAARNGQDNGSTTARLRRVTQSRGVVVQNTQRVPEAQLRGAPDAPFLFA